MDDLIADFHIHSKYSHDSLMSPESIVRRAKKVGLTCIAITDHGTIRGGVEAKKFARKYGVEVIVGTEIKTDCGDIVGLGVNEEILTTDWQHVIQEIRNQSGIVLLPHPYREHTNIEKLAGDVDFIEVWNSRCNPEENRNALTLTEKTGKKTMLGSDAHCLPEIGLVHARVNPVSYEVQEIVSANYTSVMNLRKSQVISHINRREFGKLIQRGVGLFWKKIA
jgi:hypothetical protein